MKPTIQILLLILTAWHASLARGATLQVSVHNLDEDWFRLEYNLIGTGLLLNQELAIEFDPLIFKSITNASAPVGLDLLLFQPDDPLGTAGRLSALALIDLAAPVGTIRIEVETFPHLIPGSQGFAINELDDSGLIIQTLDSGASSTTITPEPGTFQLLGLAVASCAAARRRQKTG